MHVRKDEFVSPWQRLPGWGVSLILHTVLFLVFMTTIRGCGAAAPGDPGGDFRTFGIFDADAVPDEDPEPETQSTEVSVSETASPDSAVDERPPLDAQVPTSPGIGAGAPPIPIDPPGGGVTEIGAHGGARIRGLDIQPGETSFINIRDKGKTFVYIIDRSGSMLGDRIAFARAQLVTSLRLLDPTQQYQVLFYNTQVTPLRMKGKDRNGLYPATEYNVRAASRAIRELDPNEGTRHAPALERGIRLKPDVIFFLTDGRDRPPTVGQLRQLEKLNGGRSRIHCIEFGEGDNLKPASWLRTLARRNGGKYQYVDVTRISH